MRRHFLLAVATALAALVLGACGDDDGGGGGGGSGDGGGGGPKVGFVYVSPLEGAAWTQAWNEARLALEKELNAETKYVEPIPETSDVIPAMENLIREGHEVIFATAFGYQPFVAQVARQNPDVGFVTIGPWLEEQERPENVATVYGNIWEVRYATGVLAGMMTETDKLGFVSAFSIPSVVSGINGFQQGVASVNPEATTNVVLTNSWYDPPRATQAAETLAARGVDIVAKHEDSIGPCLGAENAGIHCIGSEADTSDATPETYLTGSAYNWNEYAIEKVRQAMDGNFKGDETNGDLKSGLVELGPIHEKVPDDVRQRVERVIEQLKSGELIVFEGPLSDNQGNQVLGPNEDLVGPAEVYPAMTFFVEGVIGRVQE